MNILSLYFGFQHPLHSGCETQKVGLPRGHNRMGPASPSPQGVDPNYAQGETWMDKATQLQHPSWYKGQSYATGNDYLTWV